MSETSKNAPAFTPLARSELPTEYGTFEAIVFRMEGEDREHVALVHGDLAGKERVACRIHSECLTGEAFGSLKCDCGAQLAGAMREIAKKDGLIIYLRQEGRGIGLANKIRAYALQEKGADTVDANRLLGLPDDARTYEAAAAIIRHLGIRSVELITNNPTKIEALEKNDIEVAGRIPSLVPVSDEAREYLEVKRAKMHHLLPVRQAVPQSVAHGEDDEASRKGA